MAALTPPEFSDPSPQSEFSDPWYIIFSSEAIAVQFSTAYPYELTMSIVCGETESSFPDISENLDPQDLTWSLYELGRSRLDSEYLIIVMPSQERTASSGSGILYERCRFEYSEIPGVLRNGSQSGFFFWEPYTDNSPEFSSRVENAGVFTPVITTSGGETFPVWPTTTSSTSSHLSVIPFLTSTIDTVTTTFTPSTLSSELPFNPLLPPAVPTQSLTSSSDSNSTSSVFFPNITNITSTTSSLTPTKISPEPTSEPSPTDDNIFHGPIIDPHELDPTPLFNEIQPKTIIGIMAGVPGFFLTGIFLIFCYRMWMCVRLRVRERAKREKEAQVEEVQNMPEIPVEEERLPIEASGALPISQVVENSVRRDSGIRSVRFELDATESGLARRVGVEKSLLTTLS